MHVLWDRVASTWKSDFIRNVAVMMSGSAAGQITVFLLTPLLSRMYVAEAFGILGNIVSLASPIIIVANLRYELTIVLPAKREDARYALLLCVLITLLMTLLSILGLLVAKPFLPGTKYEEIIPYLMFVPVLVLAGGLNNAGSYWLTREKQFKRQTTALLAGTWISIGVKVLGGLAKSGPLGLIMGNVLGDGATTWVQNAKQFPALLRVRQWFKLRRMREIALQYREFPLYSAPQGLLNSISRDMPILFITSAYGLQMAGYFAMGQRLLAIPLNVVMNAFRKVFFQKAAETFRNTGRLDHQILRNTAGLAAVIAGPALFVILFGEPFFTWLLGTEWQVAGRISRSIIIWLSFLFINPPANIAAQVMGLQRWLFGFTAVETVVRLAVLLLVINTLDAEESIFYYSLICAASNIIFIVLIYLKSKRIRCKQTTTEPTANDAV